MQSSRRGASPVPTIRGREMLSFAIERVNKIREGRCETYREGKEEPHWLKNWWDFVV